MQQTHGPHLIRVCRFFATQEILVLIPNRFQSAQLLKFVLHFEHRQSLPTAHTLIKTAAIISKIIITGLCSAMQAIAHQLFEHNNDTTHQIRNKVINL
jgi:hypothetical protein